MRFCVFYVKTDHGVSADAVKEMIEIDAVSDAPLLTRHLAKNKDVDLTSFKVEKLLDSDYFVVTVDVDRSGMEWEPIQTVQLRVPPPRPGDLMM